MFASVALSLCLFGLQPRIEARTPPAIEHFIRAQIFLQRGQRPLAEAELRYALAFDHDSTFMREQLRALTTGE